MNRRVAPTTSRFLALGFTALLWGPLAIPVFPQGPVQAIAIPPTPPADQPQTASTLSVSTPTVATPVPEAPRSAPLRSYVVKDRDNLWNLAKTFFKNPWLWPEFLKFNAIPNPDLIYPGQVLLVPPAGVLEGLLKKNQEDVDRLREELVLLGTPVPIVDMEATPEVTTEPVTAIAPTPEAEEEEEPAATPLPSRTPTLKVTGSKTINLSYAEARGSGGSGTTDTGYDRHESLRLNVEGQLNDRVKLLGHFAQSDLAEEDQYDLTLSTKRWELFFGDFSATLPGSQYLSSGLSATGARLKGTYDRWNVTALYGTPKGRAVYQKFYGDETQGPYSLQTLPVVSGTETVWLNKRKLTRGVDYEIDNTLGRLTFKDRCIRAVELVEVQYQSRSAVYDTQVYGYRAEGTLVRKAKGLDWRLGQGWMRQVESPDSVSNTVTGRAAADTHLLSLDTTVDFGPPLKVSGEVTRSFLDSRDGAVMPSKRGGAYRVEADAFRGPAHAKGRWSRTEAGFTAIGNPLTSNDFREWMVQGDLKATHLMVQADHTYQDTRLSGVPDRTTTDHGEARFWPWGGGQGQGVAASAATLADAPASVSSAAAVTTQAAEAKKTASSGGPEARYVFYRTLQKRLEALEAFRQEDMRHTADLKFPMPRRMSFTLGGETETKRGTNLGSSTSRAAHAEVATEGWKRFNFSAYGEWKRTDVAEASSNTATGNTRVGNNQPSQGYRLTAEGKPWDRLTLTAKGEFSSDPPGPHKANATGTFQSNPIKGIDTNGSYTLEYGRKAVNGVERGERIHTASGALDLTPRSWLKLSAQPSMRLELLLDPSLRVSESTRQDYRANATPSFVSLNGGFTLDRLANWDPSQVGTPLSFDQRTLTYQGGLKKNLPWHLALDASYKRTDQRQADFSAVTVTTNRNLTQNTQESLAWSALRWLTLTGTHGYTQVNHYAPGRGLADNPLLPYGADTFNSSYTTDILNLYTKAHAFTFRVTEQVAKPLSIYQEGGHTRTRDVIRAGLTRTYSPAAGFTWRPLGAFSWSGSYQFNGSRGQARTEVQKAQTTLTAALNSSTNLALQWNWARAIRPEVESQQGTMSYSMNF